MRTSLRSAVLVAATAAGVMFVSSGLAGAASIGSSLPVVRAAAGGALGNYQITGVEDAVGCVTAHRCMAVGYGGGTAAGQVVTVVGGKQVRVSVVPSASNLVAVSCPNRFGCWAIGSPRIGHRNFVLVKISPVGGVRSVTRVRVQGGASLNEISCTSMTSCELFGITLTNSYHNNWYFFAWTGQKLSRPYFVKPPEVSYLAPGGISCWRETCVAVGASTGGGSASPTVDGIITTSNGVPSTARTGGGTGFSDVSCVSSSTCYATTLGSFTATPGNTVVTLDNGVAGNVQSLPTYWGSSIACAGATCWAAGVTPPSPRPAVFMMITSGVPAGSPVIDTATGGLGFPGSGSHPAIARRGNGFAALGPAASGGPDVSEVVTN